LRNLTEALRHLTGSENRATFNVTIVKFNGRRFCDIYRRLRHLAAMVRHLAVCATFNGVATYNGATNTPAITTLSRKRRCLGQKHDICKFHRVWRFVTICSVYRTLVLPNSLKYKSFIWSSSIQNQMPSSSNMKSCWSVIIGHLI
jgi:hypothetical protein